MYRKIYSHANSIRVMMMMMICDDHTYIYTYCWVSTAHYYRVSELTDASRDVPNPSGEIEFSSANG